MSATERPAKAAGAAELLRMPVQKTEGDQFCQIPHCDQAKVALPASFDCALSHQQPEIRRVANVLGGTRQGMLRAMCPKSDSAR